MLADQRPSSLQARAVQREIRIAFLQTGFGVTIRQPFALVPDLDMTGAVLSGRNVALEVPVRERMILDLDRQPLLRRITRRTFGDRPASQRALPFKTEIEMATTCMM